ncbi:hypothetical protein FDI40_gp631 [Agrobacterium phage Atu_ph07]|uniref:Uncharacterized protein n=1 Tax=Agrobacterium phage Atu_ph07 TaxID=2024264 RepID=A0A2L0V0U2_9CAUD|nr:hypothetical protein FDI40_gp631 [Agrobacterium phage Atu_ph07]AUZ95390.1 hypothetical protein [Agrobacterium phage Atu_ph07]
MFILEETAYESYLSPKIVGVYSSEAKASEALGSILMEYFEHSKETYIELVLISAEMKEPENSFKEMQNELIGFYNTHIDKIIMQTEPEYSQYNELRNKLEEYNVSRLEIIKQEYERVKKKYDTYELTKDDYEKISSRIDLKYVIRPITIDTEIEYS